MYVLYVLWCGVVYDMWLGWVHQSNQLVGLSTAKELERDMVLGPSE